MLRYLREEREALAEEWKISCLLAPGRQPLAIQVKRRRLPVISVADDAKPRAASARKLADLDRRAAPSDRWVGPYAALDAIACVRSGPPPGARGPGARPGARAAAGWGPRARSGGGGG